jgi:tetratricopeptide (TPR) repeat protein
MVTEPASAGTTYGALFARYLAEGLRHSLARVQEDPHKTPDEVRVQAWHLLSFALRVPGAWSITADLLLALSPKMLQAGYREQWLAYLEEGLVYSRAAGDVSTAAALQLEIGELLRHLGRLDAAEACFREAQAVFLAAADALQAAVAQVCLANLAFLREQWAEALSLCEEVLAAVPQTHYVRARALFVAAHVRTSLLEYQAADDLYGSAQRAWEILRQRQWAVLCRQNRAWLAAQRNELELARRLYAEALADFRALNVLHSQGVVYLDWGVTEYCAGNFTAALDLYLKAEKIFRDLDDVRCLAMTCNNIGLLYRDQKQWELAEPHYIESVRLWRLLGATLARISVEIGWARLVWERGNTECALETYARLLEELSHTERNAEHRRLYAELRKYREQAFAALETEPTEFDAALKFAG